MDHIKQYDKDMGKLLSGWIEGGDQVLLMIDANENLSKPKSGSFRHQMEKIVLNELVLSQHKILTPPPTRTPGTYTNNSMFGTPELYVVKEDMLLFLFTNHRLSRVAIQWDSALGLFQKYNIL